MSLFAAFTPSWLRHMNKADLLAWSEIVRQLPEDEAGDVAYLMQVTLTALLGGIYEMQLRKEVKNKVIDTSESFA
jgi:hypothetical protein